MHWIAFILMAVALVIFVLAHLGVTRRWVTIPLGLAFATAGLMAHFIIQADGYRVLVD